MSDYIQFEGGSFLKSFVASHENEEAFLEAANAKGHAHWFEDDPNREQKLRALYGKVSKQTNVVSAIESEPTGTKETNKVSKEDQEMADTLSAVTGSKVVASKKKQG